MDSLQGRSGKGYRRERYDLRDLTDLTDLTPGIGGSGGRKKRNFPAGPLKTGPSSPSGRSVFKREAERPVGALRG